MRCHFFIGLGILALGVGGLVMAQRPFKEWPAIEYENFPVPPDWNQKTEWTRARLRYPDIYGYPDADLTMRGRQPFPGYWTMDYPRSDRHLLEGVRRLTRIDAQVPWSRWSASMARTICTIFPFSMPWKWAIGVFRTGMRKQLREYLLRGGFLMVDDFHGSNAADNDQGINEWANFTAGISKVFPDREIEDIPDNDPDLPYHLRSERALSGARRAIFRNRAHL